jgi:hypothetical protein
MFKAYSVGLQEKDFELVRKIAKVVTTEHVTVKDLRYYDIKLENTEEDILFIFGNKACRLAGDIKAKHVVNLPDISTLHSKTGILEKRQEALKQLNILKEILEDDIQAELNKKVQDPVPEMKISDLQSLELNLKSKSINKWLTTTKNGKTVQISITPESAEADINITFAELYALRMAMEVLDVKEFTVVYSSQNSKGSIKKRTT